MRTRILVAAIVFVTGLAAGGTARAQDDKAAIDKAVSDGKASFRKEKFERAAGEFQTAYDLSKDPALLKNLGESWDKAGKPADAIAILDKVIALPGVHPQIKGAAENEKKNSEKLKAAGK